jgi:hypothetical protein
MWLRAENSPILHLTKLCSRQDRVLDVPGQVLLYHSTFIQRNHSGRESCGYGGVVGHAVPYCFDDGHALG